MRLLCSLGRHRWARTRTTTYSYIPSAVTIHYRCSRDRCPATHSELWWQGRRLRSRWRWNG